MKNKKLVYGLLAVSVLIWGWVFLKIYQVATNDSGNGGTASYKKQTVKYAVAKDTFDLLANYSDPFFKTVSYTLDYSVSPVKRAHKSQTASIQEKPPLDWSFIKYKGRIVRHSNKKTLSLLNINGNDYAIEDGKEVQQVLLVKSNSDSIQVRYEGIKKYIKRNTN